MNYYWVSLCSIQSVWGVNRSNDSNQETDTSKEDNIHAVLDVVSIDEDMLETPAQAQYIANSGQTDPAEPESNVSTTPNAPNYDTPATSHQNTPIPDADVELNVSPKVILPKVCERVRFLDPDTNQQEDYAVISCAGKARGRGFEEESLPIHQQLIRKTFALFAA